MNRINISLPGFIILLSISFAKAQQMYMPPINNAVLETITDYFKPADNIFFVDPESQILFIDFQSVKDKVVRIEIKQNDQLVFDREVRHLLSQTIYELPACLFAPGTYKVEIKTARGFI